MKEVLFTCGYMFGVMTHCALYIQPILIRDGSSLFSLASIQSIDHPSSFLAPVIYDCALSLSRFNRFLPGWLSAGFVSRWKWWTCGRWTINTELITCQSHSSGCWTTTSSRTCRKTITCEQLHVCVYVCASCVCNDAWRWAQGEEKDERNRHVKVIILNRLPTPFFSFV